MSGAEVIRFRHNDVGNLDKRLRRLGGRRANALVIVEGIYSTLGDRAPLAEVAAVKEEHARRKTCPTRRGTGAERSARRCRQLGGSALHRAGRYLRRRQRPQSADVWREQRLSRSARTHGATGLRRILLFYRQHLFSSLHSDFFLDSVVGFSYY